MPASSELTLVVESVRVTNPFSSRTASFFNPIHCFALLHFLLKIQRSQLTFPIIYYLCAPSNERMLLCRPRLLHTPTFSRSIETHCKCTVPIPNVGSSSRSHSLADSCSFFQTALMNEEPACPSSCHHCKLPSNPDFCHLPSPTQLQPLNHHYSLPTPAAAGVVQLGQSRLAQIIEAIQHLQSHQIRIQCEVDEHTSCLAPVNRLLDDVLLMVFHEIFDSSSRHPCLAIQTGVCRR